MKTIGLLMAGGQGDRMKSSRIQCPKPLVPIRGIPLLERNLYFLLAAGLRHIVISVPATIPAIRDFSLSRGRALVEAMGGELSILEEEQPLGNIGCAGLLRDVAETVLVVYADNLTTIPLRSLLEDHHQSGAALTLATHYEPFKMPFGEIHVVDNDIVDYIEKPEYPFLVCSAVSALSSPALNALPPDQSMGLSTLAQTLIRSGEKVRSFPHNSLWVDVNDATAIARADRLVSAHVQPFECWAQQSDTAVVGVLLYRPDEVLLVKSLIGNQASWSIPIRELTLNNDSVEETARQLIQELGGSPESLQPLTVFDDIDTGSRRILRYHIFAMLLSPDVPIQDGLTLDWLKLEDAVQPNPECSALIKAIAALTDLKKTS